MIEVRAYGAQVGWVAAGSIEGGKDPEYQGDNEAERKRSGLLRKMSLFFYRTDESGDLAPLSRGLEDAVARGLDVFNISMGINEPGCDLERDVNSLNAYLAIATLAGLIVTSSAGNINTSEEHDCTVTWPALRSNVISVSSLDARDAADEYIDVARFYDEDRGCSTGWKPVQVVGGGWRWLPLVDLVAPGWIEYFFTNLESGPQAYHPEAPCGPPCEIAWGTNFASPAVSALAAQTREWMEDFSYFTSCAAHPSCVATNLFVMADFYSGSLADPHQDYYTTVSKEVGYGRAYVRRPANAYLGDGAWWWNTGWIVIQQGEVQVFPLAFLSMPQPTSVEGVKIAVAWFDAAYEDIGDLDVELIDTCVPGRNPITSRGETKGHRETKGQTPPIDI